MSNPADLAVLLQNFQQMTPAEQAALIQRTQGVRATGRPTGVRMHRSEENLPFERTKLWNNYYSIVRFQSTVSVAGAVSTLTWPVQQLRPFSYRIGEALVTAGFDPTIGVATDAETNLVVASTTIAGQLVKVGGISLMPSSVTDIEVWKQLIASLSVKISMDGDANQYRLGRPDMLPASGGTFGSGNTTVLTPGLPESNFVSSSFNNGWPTVDNFYPFPEPLIWSPSGETDSNFNVVLTLQRQQVIVLTARAAAAGVAPFAPPTAAGQFGTFADFMVRLHTVQEAPRSVNQ
jgi:hypothetical protein